MEDGDEIVIDAVKRTIDWLVDEEEQKRRREKWVPREYREKRGVLYRYARDVAVSDYPESAVRGDGLTDGIACEPWRVLRLRYLKLGYCEEQNL